MSTPLQEKREDDIMDWGHDGTLGTNYSPLGIIIGFPMRGTSLCASLACGPLPTRPKGCDAQACMHHFAHAAISPKASPSVNSWPISSSQAPKSISMILTGSHGKSTRICMIVCGLITRRRRGREIMSRLGW